MKKVVLIDDDQLVTISLKTILESGGNISVEAIGKDGNEAFSLYEKYEPDVLLMDIQMQQQSGLSAAEEILKKHPGAKILLLTTFRDDEYIVSALRIGAKGYILKQDFEAIEPAVLAVAGGQTVFGGEVMERIPGLLPGVGNEEKEVPAEEMADVFKEKGISEKEFAIIEGVAEGLNNKELADSLFLSEGTVRNYLSTILEKLELRDRTQLAVYYWKQGELKK
ncbi:MAG: response regulator transcription factor [Lachnospiraceae bacterium]|nr:response regulator transcription factor [Lachnospiraceae bacterium]